MFGSIYFVYYEASSIHCGLGLNQNKQPECLNKMSHTASITVLVRQARLTVVLFWEKILFVDILSN